jgi:hypothetical protein
MNLKHGGKKPFLRNTVIPTDDPLIPSHLRGQRQTMTYNQSHPNPNLAGKQKGIQAILEEQGLWSHYTHMIHSSGQPPLKLQCASCTASNIKKDALERAAQLIRQAEVAGYFLSEDQALAKLPPSESVDNSDPLPDAETNTNTFCDNTNSKTCCWSRIMSLQSDFVNEQPLLQTLIKDAAHVCLFLPKFHCELNPIELFWSYIKQGKFVKYVKKLHTNF